MTRKEQALAVWAEVKACTKCSIAQVVRHKVFGDGLLQASVALVGEAPGMEEDACGHPFVGASGRILDKALAAASLDRRKMFVCNVLRCHPPERVDPEVAGNRAPMPQEIDNCSGYLRATLNIVQPTVIVALGAVALNALANPVDPAQPRVKYAITEHFARYWYAKDYPGWGLPAGALLVAAYHPQYLSHNRRESVATEYNQLFRYVKQIASGTRTPPAVLPA